MPEPPSSSKKSPAIGHRIPAARREYSPRPD
jgi:hypothetical protein